MVSIKGTKLIDTIILGMLSSYRMGITEVLGVGMKIAYLLIIMFFLITNFTNGTTKNSL